MPNKKTTRIEIWPDIDLLITERKDGRYQVAVFNRQKETTEKIGLFSKKNLSLWLEAISAQKHKQTPNKDH